jgi:ribonuclease HI
LGAKSTYQQIVVDPKVVEVMAALNAVQFCKEVGFLDVMLEGDASQVIREVNSGPPILSRIGHFVESIRREVKFLLFNFLLYFYS